MIVCICKNVNSAQISEAASRGANSLEALQQETGLGSCCGKCRFKANALLSSSPGVSHYQPQQKAN